MPKKVYFLCKIQFLIVSILNTGGLKRAHHYTRFIEEVFDIINFVTVSFNIHCRKMRFSASSQISINGKSITGQFEVLVLNV